MSKYVLLRSAAVAVEFMQAEELGIITERENRDGNMTTFYNELLRKKIIIVSKQYLQGTGRYLIVAFIFYHCVYRQL